MRHCIGSSFVHTPIHHYPHTYDTYASVIVCGAISNGSSSSSSMHISIIMLTRNRRCTASYLSSISYYITCQLLQQRRLWQCQRWQLSGSGWRHQACRCCFRCLCRPPPPASGRSGSQVINAAGIYNMVEAKAVQVTASHNCSAVFFYTTQFVFPSVQASCGCRLERCLTLQCCQVRCRRPVSLFEHAIKGIARMCACER